LGHDDELTVVRRLKRDYCGTCWMHHCQFRFRKRLFEIGRPGKGTKLSNWVGAEPETVLVDWNDSDSGWSLLNLIRDSARECCVTEGGSVLDKRPDSKNILLPFKFMVLYIVDSYDSKTLPAITALRKWQEETLTNFSIDVPIVLSSLECLMSFCNGKDKQMSYKILSTLSETQGSIRLPFYPETWKQVANIVSNFKSATSEKDFICQIRNNLMVQLAKEINATKIFVPEDQSYMATKMFFIISIGRGLQLAEQMALTTTVGNVKITRPLMDLTTEDFKDYMRCFKGICSLTATQPSSSTLQVEIASEVAPSDTRTKKGKIAKTIQTECEEFVTDLQAGYPSTVPTLSRIGTKLRPAVIDSDPSLTATLNPHPTASGDFAASSTSCILCKQNRRDTQEKEALDLQLCYGCFGLLQDSKDQFYLREFLQQISTLAQVS